MSGHSKWSSIKHKKARVDAQRGKVFTKIIREIMVAARMGGGDPELNPRLRLAVDKARGSNMPWDNIERAIKKGTGELEGQEFESVVYEGYGPGGIAILVDVLTDNKNRTASEVRHTFSKYGGHLAGTGSVAWQFKAKGVLYIDKSQTDEDTVLEIALEGGAEDVKTEGDTYEIFTNVKDFMAVKTAFEEKEIEVGQASLTKIPQNQVKVEGKDAAKILKLIDFLEELDDVQDVYANFDISDEVLETLSG
jgi:YebC/PmpR family DNA-binding regulatory protein